jgi:hypothetical protein
VRAVNALIVRISGSPRLFLGVTALAFGSLFGVLLPLGDAIAARTGGLPPFDLQNTLNSATVLEQLEAWTPAATRRYYLFAAVDFVFPLTAALFQGAVAAFALRRLSARLFAVADRHALFALFLAAALFDWLENAGALAVVVAWPAELRPAAAMLVSAKQAKLLAVTVQNGVAGALLVAAAVQAAVGAARRLAAGGGGPVSRPGERR